jgi:16S rRNA (adenine1518-N6/adenine1519-N6)-dimethyltransferase
MLNIPNFHPSKKMGQNFLINKNTAQKITDLICYNQYDAIIEIGPGTGALTEFLVEKHTQIIVIELDKRLASDLKIKYPNIKLINNDILQVDLEEILKQYKNPIMISNLPYSISSPFIFQYLSLISPPPFICMLQKEFVERLLAKPKTKQYSGFTVIVQTYLNIEKKIIVSKNNFLPKPQIDSEVIKIKRNNKEFDIKFNEFVKICFSFKRKTLLNNLKQHFHIDTILMALKQIKINMFVRSEELEPKTFLNLYNILQNAN